ncbi:hypothetical protein G6F68_015751 [Rhizopus microsporus]|nr:hypothetical protein G6F68_015751 [Rhizopus microsporus]
MRTARLKPSALNAANVPRRSPSSVAGVSFPKADSLFDRPMGRTEYEVALRPIDFKEYKWSYWTFEDGHLIHPHTGLALDATPTKGVLLEDGLQSSLFVREKSMSLYQFWSLTASAPTVSRSRVPKSAFDSCTSVNRSMPRASKRPP